MFVSERVLEFSQTRTQAHTHTQPHTYIHTRTNTSLSSHTNFSAYSHALAKVGGEGRKNTCRLTCQEFLARVKESEPTNQIAAKRKLHVT